MTRGTPANRPRRSGSTAYRTRLPIGASRSSTESEPSGYGTSAACSGAPSGKRSTRYDTGPPRPFPVRAVSRGRRAAVHLSVTARRSTLTRTVESTGDCAAGECRSSASSVAAPSRPASARSSSVARRTAASQETVAARSSPSCPSRRASSISRSTAAARSFRRVRKFASTWSVGCDGRRPAIRRASRSRSPGHTSLTDSAASRTGPRPGKPAATAAASGAASALCTPSASAASAVGPRPGPSARGTPATARCAEAPWDRRVRRSPWCPSAPPPYRHADRWTCATARRSPGCDAGPPASTHAPGRGTRGRPGSGTRRPPSPWAASRTRSSRPRRPGPAADRRHAGNPTGRSPSRVRRSRAYRGTAAGRAAAAAACPYRHSRHPPVRRAATAPRRGSSRSSRPSGRPVSGARCRSRSG